MVPFVVIGIGAGVVSVGGVAVAAWKMHKDKKRYEERREAYEWRHNVYVGFARRTQDRRDDLYRQRVAAVETLRQSADFLVRANVKERDWDVPNITAEQIKEIEDVVASLGDTAARLGFSYVGSGAAGAVAAAGTYAAAGAFGTASTGAAISGLAGAAARNATLAWLGGGSLASGGGGIAAGMASLAGIALTPLAIIPPIVTWTRAARQSREIDEAIADMEVHEAKFGRHRAELSAFQARVREMSEAVGNAERALKDVLQRASPDELADIHRVAILAKALADILDTKD